MPTSGWSQEEFHPIPWTTQRKLCSARVSNTVHLRVQRLLLLTSSSSWPPPARIEQAAHLVHLFLLLLLSHNHNQAPLVSTHDVCLCLFSYLAPRSARYAQPSESFSFSRFLVAHSLDRYTCVSRIVRVCVCVCAARCGAHSGLTNTSFYMQLCRCRR